MQAGADEGLPEGFGPDDICFELVKYARTITRTFAYTDRHKTTQTVRHTDRQTDRQIGG